MKVLVTGGAGYIGSTICSALEDSGHTSVILDSLCTGRIEFVRDRIFYKGDIADSSILNLIFKEHPDIKHVIHCAALILVPESVEKPYDYYKENVTKSIELFQNLREHNCTNIVYSSSASIYDDAQNFVVNESAQIRPKSPYAKTKLMTEMILEDFCESYQNFKSISLRYFNPVGADPKMRSGIQVKESSHIIWKLVDTALGYKDEFTITGTDWPTRDGSGIRDYIHVWDLAMAHVHAVENFEFALAQNKKNKNNLCINIGTGTGVTVKELVDAFEKVFGSRIPQKYAPPRPGDVAGVYADPKIAQTLLKWNAKLNIEAAIHDALRWGKIRKSVLNL